MGESVRRVGGVGGGCYMYDGWLATYSTYLYFHNVLCYFLAALFAWAVGVHLLT